MNKILFCFCKIFWTIFVFTPRVGKSPFNSQLQINEDVHGMDVTK